MKIEPEDLIITTYRHAIASVQFGGIHCVRITHKPTGITVCSEDIASSRHNQKKALAMLEEKLDEMEKV